METAERSADFAIESQADILLSRLSDEVSNLLLSMASRTATKHTPSGIPIVTKTDITTAAHFLSNALREAEQNSANDTELRDILSRLREKIESIRVEREDVT